MDYLRLVLGLSLPWIAGYLWLAALEARFDTRSHHPARKWGYGFLLGYALLFGLIRLTAVLQDQVSYGLVMTGLAVIAIVGLLLAWRRGAPLQPPSTIFRRPRGYPMKRGRLYPIKRGRPGGGPVSLPQTPLFWLLLGLLILHLGLAAIEVLHRPVFPWDAWLAWIYRAKAWFYAGDIYTLATPDQWLAGSHASPYAIAAAGYPTFASVIPFWAAISLGEWSETLVNTPLIAGAIALVLALYGQCREQGMNSTWSLAACYGLLAIPMVGTHLSLVGYADIWMAMFVGLGFIALLRGYLQARRFPTLFGLALIAMGITIKHEGMVWLYLALATLLALRLRLRTGAALIILLGMVGWGAWAAGVTALDIPGIGLLGVSDGRVHIPLVGSYRLQYHEVGEAYWIGFFVHNSWNLLWPILVLAALALPWAEGRVRKAAIILLAGLAASQYFIFALTEQGKWAISFTAINRVPMQLAPALVFVAATVLHSVARRRPGRVTAAEPGAGLTRGLAVPAFAAALMTTAGLAWWVAPGQSTRTTDPVVKEADGLKFLMGSGTLEGSSLEVTRYDQGMAVIAPAKGRHDARQYNSLRLDFESAGSHMPRFFWRRSDNPQGFFSEKLEHGQRYLYLGENEAWRGQIIEYGLIFSGAGDARARVERITLMPPSLLAALGQAVGSWHVESPWSAVSINMTAFGKSPQVAPVVQVLMLWIALTLVFTVLLRLATGRGPALAQAVPATLVIAWLLLDSPWLWNRVQQAGTTLALAEAREGPYLDLGHDRQVAQLAAEVNAFLGDDPGGIAIVSESAPDNFEALRTKYHLLPRAAVSVSGSQLQGTTVPYVLFISNKLFNANVPVAAGLSRLRQDSGLGMAMALDADYALLLKTGAGHP